MRFAEQQDVPCASVRRLTESYWQPAQLLNHQHLPVLCRPSCNALSLNGFVRKRKGQLSNYSEFAACVDILGAL